MKDVGGIIVLEETVKKSWYEKIVDPSDGTHFYCLIYTLDNQPVGEVSFHRYNKEIKTADFNVKIHHAFRGKGYANEAIRLILEYFFFEFGGEVMVDHIALNNENGKKALLKFGFEFISEDEEAYNVEITKDRFISIYGKKN